MYMQPSQISSAVMTYLEWFIQVTKDMAGASDAVLGEATPTNTSAIIVNSKNAAVPLSSIKRRYYKYIEDVGLIWLDFFISKYTEYPQRSMELNINNTKQVVEFDTSVLKDIQLKLKIDVGAGTQWDEAATQQTLDNLLAQQLITFVEYLERIGETIPDKQALIDKRNEAEAMQKQQEERVYL